MLLQKTVGDGITGGPTLASGAFTQGFGEFAKIVSAAVKVTNPFTSAYELGVSWAVANNNTLVVTSKLQNLGSPTTWANAITTDVQACIYTMIVDGE
jgi:hypothetical protein